MLLLLLMVGAVVGYDQSVNYWEAFAPGKLLQRLDALTATDMQHGQVNALTEQQRPSAQAKLDEDADDDEEIEAQAEMDADADADVDADADSEAIDHDGDVEQLELDSHSAEGHSGEDYERNYEQFVRQYFDRIPDDAADDVDGHQAQLDDSVESQAGASSNVQQHRCRRVQRNGQLCKICREARNNEVTETCSYSHEAQPEHYAYDSGSQYKRYRDAPSSDEQSEEEDATVRQRRTGRQTSIVQPGADSSLCERRMVGNSVCYDCKDSGGQHMRRCYDAALNKQIKSRAKPGRPHGGESQQSEQEQRLYKRTISYSYAQGSSPDDRMTPTQPTPARNDTRMPSSLSPPARRLTKVLRRRVAIPIAAV
ncbi:uncharacterized protein [Drosophila virilis]|uniref:Uncharacterized protein n=1 Tax=Drosophila virilis TaxID=7244 RepID=B4M2X4_DROVI|nr:uncharacterized protein LOC6631954 [Drosophila virilis]EDW65149.1 uncharacterized protein Dvir_GJ19100 [Drosophila virilis]